MLALETMVVGVLRGHRRLPLLHAVRGHADPDVLPDRRLRRPGHAATRRRQLYAAVKFLLYNLLGGLLMLVAVIGLYVCAGSLAAATSIACGARRRHAPHGDRHRAVAVPRLLLRLRGQGAAVAVPHLAARRRCARRPRRRRRAARRRVWTRSARSACCASASSCSRSASKWFTPAGRGARRDQHHLRGAARDRPARHEAPDRLHVDLALRLHHAGHLRDDQPGPVRRDALHGQPRLLDRRAVPGGRLPDLAPRLPARSRTTAACRRSPRCSPARSWSAGLAALSLPGLAPFVSEFLVLVGTFSRYRWPAWSPLSASSWPRSTSCAVPADDDRPGQRRRSRACRTSGRELLVVAPLIALLVCARRLPQAADGHHQPGGDARPCRRCTSTDPNRPRSEAAK